MNNLACLLSENEERVQSRSEASSLGHTIDKSVQVRARISLPILFKVCIKAKNTDLITLIMRGFKNTQAHKVHLKSKKAERVKKENIFISTVLPPPMTTWSSSIPKRQTQRQRRAVHQRQSHCLGMTASPANSKNWRANI